MVSLDSECGGQRVTLAARTARHVSTPPLGIIGIMLLDSTMRRSRRHQPHTNANSSRNKFEHTLRNDSDWARGPGQDLKQGLAFAQPQFKCAYAGFRSNTQIQQGQGSQGVDLEQFLAAGVCSTPGPTSPLALAAVVAACISWRAAALRLQNLALPHQLSGIDKCQTQKRSDELRSSAFESRLPAETETDRRRNERGCGLSSVTSYCPLGGATLVSSVSESGIACHALSMLTSATFDSIMHRL